MLKQTIRMEIFVFGGLLMAKTMNQEILKQVRQMYRREKRNGCASTLRNVELTGIVE